MTQSATSELLIDNNDVRIMKWVFQPNQSTGIHKHNFDYVVVPSKSGQLKIVSNNETTISDMVIHEPYHRKKGVIHEVIYEGSSSMEFIEIEIKS